MEATEAYGAVEQGRKNKGERRKDNVIPWWKAPLDGV
jgi:hypothetical protein